MDGKDSVGTKIEQSVELILQVADVVSKMQATIDSNKQEIAMFQTLHDLNNYISTNLDLEVLLPVIEDSIKGILGVSFCKVIVESDDNLEKYECGLSITNNDLRNIASDRLYIEDLSKSPKYDVNKGSLLILKMQLENEDYGYLLAYWVFPCALTESISKFMSILSTQIGMTIKTAKLVKRLKIMASHDVLTGVYNRSYINGLGKSSNAEIGECMISFDIDDFKSINDNHGHSAGDETLQVFARVLKEHCDDKNIVCCRNGGDEFVIKCNCGEAKAYELAENIRKKFYKLTGYVVSTGIATVGEACRVASYNLLYKMSDNALYTSKQCGGNKTTIYNSDMHLFEMSKVGLTAALAKSLRSNTMPNMIRLDIVSPSIITLGEMDKLREMLNGVVRAYDNIYVSESLSAMLIIDNAVPIESVLLRLKADMSKYFPDYLYKTYIINNIFKEVHVHSTRIAELVQFIGRELGLDERDKQKIQLACEWHDIGKLGISPEVYTKPGKLSFKEYERVKFHAWLGYSIARQHRSLKSSADWILYHHENYDGSGYYGLVGDEIPLQAQMISLADRFDALTENRCYRKAFTWSEAIQKLESEEHKYNPELLGKFKDIIVRIYKK